VSVRLPPGSQGCPPEEVVEPQAGLPTVEQVLAARPTGRGDWDCQAACFSSEHDPELWWPAGHTDPAVEARRVCAGCPVLGDCRDAFLARPGDRDGIWAGLRGYDLLKAARRPAPAVDRLARLITPARQPDQALPDGLAVDERTPSPTRGMR
jgi:Transcription factor WhiB